MRKTTSSVSAASIQLRNCSCMVGSRPPGPARAGARSWGWRAQRQAPEPPRAAPNGADTLRSRRVRAGGGGGGGDSGRQGWLRRGEPARSLSAPVRPSSLLSSPPFPRPARGSARSLTASLSSSALLLPPQSTPVSSLLPLLLPPGFFQLPRALGCGRSLSLPLKEAGLGAPRASAYRAEPREERAPPGVPRRLANALPRSLFVQRPRFLTKFSGHKDQHLGTAPSARRGGRFSQADVSAVDELGGVVEEGEGRRNIQDRPTLAEMQTAICGRGARPPRNHRGHLGLH